MMCQNCQKREATTHIKRIVNGEATESHLCSECAHSLGYDNMFDNFSLNIPDFFSGFFGDNPFALSSSRTDRCEKCGSSFDDIIKSGMVGCADCYEKFFDKLLPSVQRIHGKAKHQGRRPHLTGATGTKVKEKEKVKTKDEIIAEKQQQMQKAVEEQNFEQAAVIRDEIKKLKEEN